MTLLEHDLRQINSKLSFDKSHHQPMRQTMKLAQLRVGGMVATRRLDAWLALAFAVMPVTSALALSAPDAGALQQQIEREQTRPVQPQWQTEVIAPSPKASPKRGNALEIRGFKFQGNKLLNSEALAGVLAIYKQKSLDFSEIDALTHVLEAHYRAKGYLAFVGLPDQDVSDGVLTFVVIEAVMGKVVVTPQKGARTDAKRVQALVAKQLPSGQVFRVESLDRALLLANDLPGVAVTGALAEGEAAKSTDLVLNVMDKPLWSGDASLDNAGGRATGVNRRSLNLNGNGVMGLGDQWSANVLANQGSTYQRLGFTVPVGLDGWRLGANTSRMDYRIVDADYSSQKLEGSSAVVGLEASYPLVRKPQQNLYVAAALDKKNFTNYASGSPVSDYGSRALGLSLYGNRFDDFAGGGGTTGNLTFTQGNLTLDAYAAHANDASTVQTAGDFGKLRYALSRQQFIAKDAHVLVSWSGQWANKNLDSSEKFSLGGATGVRAYPSNEGMGTIGQLLSAELHWRWSEALSSSAFYDTGRVEINARNNYAGASPLNAYSLSGAGLALAWKLDNRLSAKLTWARRIGSNPNPTANGNDQNGSPAQDRLWASTTLSF